MSEKLTEGVKLEMLFCREWESKVLIGVGREEEEQSSQYWVNVSGLFCRKELKDLR